MGNEKKHYVTSVRTKTERVQNDNNRQDKKGNEKKHNVTSVRTKTERVQNDNNRQDKKGNVTSVRTKTERVQNVRSDEKWILDSGASIHITNKTKNLSDIRSDPTVIVTPAGEKLLYLKGNRNSEIQDVLVNKDGEFSLVSVGKYLKDNPKSSIIFTKKGAYEINNIESMKIPYERKICHERDNLYYFEKGII